MVAGEKLCRHRTPRSPSMTRYECVSTHSAVSLPIPRPFLSYHWQQRFAPVTIFHHSVSIDPRILDHVRACRPRILIVGHVQYRKNRSLRTPCDRLVECSLSGFFIAQGCEDSDMREDSDTCAEIELNNLVLHTVVTTHTCAKTPTCAVVGNKPKR